MMKLGFGLMRLPIIGDDRTNIDIEAFKKMADAFIAAGGTYFDTAYVYHGGKSEVAFREAVVKRYPRDAFTVTDKLPLWAFEDEETMEKLFNEQLERCGVDHFDYYWLHAIGDGSYEKVQRLHCFDFIAKKKAEGKTKHIGFSCHCSPATLERILTDHPEVEYVQLQINYIDWNDNNVCSGEIYDIATRHGKPVIVMEPVKGGALANVPAEAASLMNAKNPGMSAASWAIRYVASLENVYMVLSGMSNQAQTDDNIGYMKDFRPLDDEEQDIIRKSADIIRAQLAIPCTGCRYCITEQECPVEIRIPDLFDAYNKRKNYSLSRSDSAALYEKLTDGAGKAGDCLECGGCEGHCPQNLGIRELLKNVAASFEKK
ncbi:MAG: aldo/keto reductase [Clostridia bacterium]|nr:aldo/keto reductase [Clostridia bacterium]